MLLEFCAATHAVLLADTSAALFAMFHSCSQRRRAQPENQSVRRRAVCCVCARAVGCLCDACLDLILLLFDCLLEAAS